MKIAQLSTRYPPGPGGVERHLGEISRRLVQRGHEVHAYATELYREYPWEPLPADVPREEVRERVHVHRLRAWSLPWEFQYPFFRGLDSALTRDRPDVIHVHTYGTDQAAIAHRYGKRERIPYVMTAHYHPIWSIYGGWLRHRLRGFYDDVLAGPIVGGASRLVVQSHEEERLMRVNGFPLPPVEIIPPGYTPLPSPVEGGRAFAKAFNLPGPYVLFVGRLASNKGLLPLLDAFVSLARHDPAATLVLAGEDGGMRAAIEQRTKDRGLTGRVKLTGFVADDGLLAAGFREARIFVLPSEYESFGLVLLEALAQGTPVIASRVGGIPEFIENGRAGLLVPRLESGPLSDALLKLWDDPTTRERMGAYGRAEVVPRYSWDRVTERLEGVYRSVVGN